MHAGVTSAIAYRPIDASVIQGSVVRPIIFHHVRIYPPSYSIRRMNVKSNMQMIHAYLLIGSNNIHTAQEQMACICWWALRNNHSLNLTKTKTKVMFVSRREGQTTNPRSCARSHACCRLDNNPWSNNYVRPRG